MRDTDRALVQAASAVAKLRCRSAAHTLATAARTADGRVVSAVNVVHPTAGACPEVVALGTAVTQGVGELETMVTVGTAAGPWSPPATPAADSWATCSRRCA
ncbi:hypothetical protein [Micromonospora sp. NPDC047134]|uniref:hypothetical protein n=1 Tax=Micromonospora sp. NPDC047134 TaxID=3154340 RepID=UPI0033D13BA3